MKCELLPIILILILILGLTASGTCHAQPQRIWTFWEHGTLLSPGDPNKIAKASMSAGTRVYEGYENTTAVFYAPLSNPSLLAGQSSRLQQIRLLFKTVGNAQITGLTVYGGKQALKKFSGLQLAGDFSLPSTQQLLPLDPVIAVKGSLNIAITVQFGSKADSVVPAINFVSIGTDFQRIALGDIHVYDSHGHYIGVLIGHQDTDITGMHIFIPKMEKAILLDKETGDIGRVPFLYYSSYDCSGPAYSDGPRDIVFKVPGVKGYRFIESGNPAQTYVGSFNYYGYCYSTGEIYILAESQEILKAQIPFTLPVGLPLQYKYQ